MEKIFRKDILRNEGALRECFDNGFRYFVEGDYQVAPKCDEYGCPVVNSNIHMFDNEVQAHNFADGQCWPFSNDRPKVCDLQNRICDLNKFDANGEDIVLTQNKVDMYNNGSAVNNDIITANEKLLKKNEVELEKLNSKVEELSNIVTNLQNLIVTGGQFGERPSIESDTNLSNEELLNKYENQLKENILKMKKLASINENARKSIDNTKTKISKDDDVSTLLKRLY